MRILNKLGIVLFVLTIFLVVMTASAYATECWLYDDNMTGCEAQPNCNWQNNSVDTWCEMLGCWVFNGNQTGCDAAVAFGLNCNWVANNLNQAPWCPIKQVGDMSPSGPVVIADDVGCCEMQGCWNRAGTNESYCEDPNFAGGICEWHHKNSSNPVNYDPYCTDPIGCCVVPPCETFTGNQTKCAAANALGFNCNWNDPNCASGGCIQYNNNQEECINNGCSYNAVGECKPPEFGGVGGGFMGSQRCWFADNNPAACMNVSGCVYCTDDVTLIEAQSYGGNISNSTSFCYQKTAGYCEGHDPEVNASYIENSASLTALGDPLASDDIECADIKIKMACDCGPFPMCKWSNSSAIAGDYCTFINRTKTNDEMTSCRPTINGEDVKFCEDPKVTNEGNCSMLKTSFNMPCEWDSTNNKCMFMFESIFKGGPVGDMWEIDNTNGGETACLAAKGVWNCELYEDESGSIQEDCFCGMGTTDSGSMVENCDSFCPACEFYFNNGSTVDSLEEANLSCSQSSLGFCQFEENSGAPNGFGFCHEPAEFKYGMGDCKSDCKSCGIVSTDPAQQEAACWNSTAGCVWVDSQMGTFCQENTKQTCNTDCAACMTQTDCENTALNCEWDLSYYYCKATGFTGEVCFDTMDNDFDGQIDCADSDCLFDEFCGGAMYGNCGQYWNDSTTCAASTVNMSGTLYNCTWVYDMYSNFSRCANPGENCWMMSMTNETACNATSGCGWVNLTAEGDPGWCEVNQSKASSCMNKNNITCAASPGCAWNDPDGPGPMFGWCDFGMFVTCGQLNSTACDLNINCTWKTDPMGGHCEPGCFNDMLNITTCTAIPSCKWTDTECRPVFMVDCADYDGNSVGCAAESMCQYYNSSGEELCDPKAGSMVFGNIGFGGGGGGGMNNNMMGSFEFFHIGDDDYHDWELPSGWTGTADENDTLEAVDIRYFGIKDFGDQVGIGIGVTQTKEAAMCNGKPDHWPDDGTDDNTGTNSTKFYWYLDTDDDTTNSCSATDQDGNTVTGFEFLMTYYATWNAGSLSESKTFYVCQNGSFVTAGITLYLDKSVSCQFIGGAAIAVDKESLEKFPSLYDSTAPMRIFVASGYNTTHITDSANPGYFTAGTVDFKTECCMCAGDPDMDGDGKSASTDEDCTFIKQKGFMPFEDCFNGNDDNNDDLVDCDDPMCAPMPKCGGTFTFAANPNDKKAPTVMFQKVDEWADGAFIKFDTDEPANGEVKFYGEDSMCSALNTSIADEGDPDVTFDDYKPFHGVVLGINSLGYALDLSTSYYYKLRVEDPSGNAGESACLNFTTKSTFKKVLFDIDLDSGYLVDISCPGFNKTNWTGEYAIKVNLSYTKNCNLTIKCGEEELYEITLIGVDIAGPDDIDLQGKLVCDEANNMIGMDSDEETWSETLYDLGMGGSGDKIKEEYPTEYDEDNILYHCDEDNTSDCDDISDYANCTASEDGGTNCFIPTSIGYSAHQVSTPSGGTTPPSGGGGGGGGGGAATLPGTSRYWDNLPIGEAKMQVSSDDYGIKEITFNAKESGKKVKFQLEKLTKDPANITSPGELIFKYLKLTVYNYSDDQVQGNVKLKFIVTKSWLEKNGLTPNDVVLKRYINGEWVELPTKVTMMSDTIAVFIAESPGFSYYAIVGKTALPAEETTPTGGAIQEEEAVILEEDKGTELPTAQHGEKKPFDTSKAIGEMLLVIAAFVFVALLVLTIAKKSKKK